MFLSKGIQAAAGALTPVVLLAACTSGSSAARNTAAHSAEAAASAAGSAAVQAGKDAVDRIAHCTLEVPKLKGLHISQLPFSTKVAAQLPQAGEVTSFKVTAAIAPPIKPSGPHTATERGFEGLDGCMGEGFSNRNGLQYQVNKDGTVTAQTPKGAANPFQAIISKLKTDDKGIISQDVYGTYGTQTQPMNPLAGNLTCGSTVTIETASNGALTDVLAVNRNNAKDITDTGAATLLPDWTELGDSPFGKGSKVQLGVVDNSVGSASGITEASDKCGLPKEATSARNRVYIPGSKPGTGKTVTLVSDEHGRPLGQIIEYDDGRYEVSSTARTVKA